MREFVLPPKIHQFTEQMNALAMGLASWWLSELKLCAPQRILTLVSRLIPQPLEMHFGGDSITIIGPDLTRKTTVDPSASAKGKREIIQALTLSVAGRHNVKARFILTLPAENFLVRNVRIPSSVGPRVIDIMLKDMELRTPLKADDVLTHCDIVGRVGAKLDILQTIIKKSIIVAACNQLGLILDDVVAVRMAGEENKSRPPVATRFDKTPDGKYQSLISRAPKILWFLVFLLALLFGFLAVRQGENDITLLENQQRELRNKAVLVRSAIDKLSNDNAALSAIRLRKTNQADARDIIEEITLLLPDTAWLTELRIGEQDTTLSGYAMGAANLISLFGKSNIFQSAALNAPIIVDPVENRERFSIILKHRTVDQAPAVRQP